MKTLLISALVATVALSGCQTVSHAAQQAQNTVQAAMQSKTERNKANAIAFYDLAFNQHKVQEAADKYIGDVYLQHNPNVPDGKEAFVKIIGGFIGQTPQARSHIKRVIAEGDLVVLHIHSQPKPNTLGSSVVDIFRFDENGKIVEHWDTIQAVPEKTVSGRSMF
ncbi:nuclear transport factor 2 family protein [Alysiella crassa]|uniref:Predicted ester cyclase n=1 Tax=Alysiella crassa TaxID=153491 RepID=A0A376BKQ2_9NEIS|nr:nuclear transport factor 2 family protein [Alysiella crassa]UOP07476.1 nuclear transport factor 2 family protein [Alysiella crassa]SSY70332.1 Predicted ester cyclase [Alysiella crassa]